MQVVDALIKADKDFELLVVPGGEHSVGTLDGPDPVCAAAAVRVFMQGAAGRPRDWLSRRRKASLSPCGGKRLSMRARHLGDERCACRRFLCRIVSH